jgi:ATP adenylyltransferase
MAYVSGTGSAPGCIFCAAAGGGSETLTLVRGERVFALLNRYPYTSGHLMVAPIAHVGDLSGLDGPTIVEMMGMAQRLVGVLRDVYSPHGFNLGLNLGESAGAGVVDHVHLHLVPRWRGDTNFMSVSAGLRVLPEDLTDTCTRLRSALEAGHA